jgi:anaerobic ribonucleoside-triphosphate reductase
MGLEEKIRAIFDSGNAVKIEKVKRTKSGETYYQYIWSMDESSTTNWFGFNTIDECVEDCITVLTISYLM